MNRVEKCSSRWHQFLPFLAQVLFLGCGTAQNPSSVPPQVPVQLSEPPPSTTTDIVSIYSILRRNNPIDNTIWSPWSIKDVQVCMISNEDPHNVSTGSSNPAQSEQINGSDATGAGGSGGESKKAPRFERCKSKWDKFVQVDKWFKRELVIPQRFAQVSASRDHTPQQGQPRTSTDQPGPGQGQVPQRTQPIRYLIRLKIGKATDATNFKDIDKDKEGNDNNIAGLLAFCPEGLQNMDPERPLSIFLNEALRVTDKSAPGGIVSKGTTTLNESFVPHFSNGLVEAECKDSVPVWFVFFSQWPSPDEEPIAK